MRAKKSVTTKFLTIAILAAVILAAGLVLVMTYFMNSLTDTILLNMLRPMSEMGARSAEARLRAPAERFLSIGEGLTSPDTQRAHLENARAESGLLWIGVYGTDGALIAGSEGCPASVAEHSVYSMIQSSGAFSIADTRVDSAGGTPETLVGMPLASAARLYLIGAYPYDVIGDAVRGAKVAANGTAFIVARDGHLVAHADEAGMFDGESVADLLGSAAGAQTLLRLAEQGQAGAIGISAPAGELFVGYAPIRGTDRYFCIQAPRADFASSVRQAVLIGAVLTAVALAVFTTVLIVLIRRILTAPLYAITSGAQRLARGRFENGLPRGLLNRND